ncbi:MAG TPA: outer membrane protein assembly factor BamA [Candidatus Omnitrophota bacterium]|nr:outer membrane protein assembly factor BamA [Candidatus Omnitrophota bacterium]
MDKKLCIMLLCWGLFFNAAARAQTVSQPDNGPAGASGQDTIVTAIEVKGNTSISANTVLSKLKTRIGSPYNDNVISDDMKRLYLLGYFSDIKIDTEKYMGGMKVIITVVERPLIEKISFSGSRRIGMSEEKLKETLRSKETQYLDYTAVAEDVETLRKMYEKKGFTQVQIEHTVDIDESLNKARISFKISEGRKKKIRMIYVEGNWNVSDSRILKIIKTKRAWLFNSGILKEDVLEEDIERVKAYYQRKGYMDVSVEKELKTDPRGRFWYITLKVAEGKKYLVGNVAIQGNADVNEADIRAKIKECKPGNVFSQEALKEDVMAVQGVYFDRGYIAAKVLDTTSLNTSTGNIDIVLSIEENEVFYVGQVKIRGNVKTKDVVIRREMRIYPGDRFDGEKLRRSKERLQNLGFFDEISYDTEDSDAPDKKDLVVDVRESKTGAFSFGGGYSSVDRLVGFIEISQKNFDWKNWPYFTGAGQDLKVRATMGSVTEAYDLSFTEPWLFDYPASFGFDLYKHTHDRDSDVGYGYNEDITGGDIRLGKELSEYVRGNLTYRHDTIKISDVEVTASQDLKDEVGTNVESSMEFGLTYDNRDNVFDPTRGNVLGGSIQVAGGPFGGDRNFWKYFGNAAHYFGVGKAVIDMRLRAGVADSYDDSNKVPINSRLFAGGAYTIRGYRERKVGPVDSVTGDPLGGRSLLVGNVEYLYPLSSFFKLALFYDIGNVWPKVSDIGSGGYRAGTGLGFRLKTPIGPVMLDYGIPLDKESGETERGNGRFHFSMSHGF